MSAAQSFMIDPAFYPNLPLSGKAEKGRTEKQDKNDWRQTTNAPRPMRKTHKQSFKYAIRYCTVTLTLADVVTFELAESVAVTANV